VNADRRPIQKARDRFPGAGSIRATILPDMASLFLASFSWQIFSSGAAATARRIHERVRLAYDSMVIPAWGRLMYFVAAVLAVLAGLFYAAGNNEIGSLGVQMCQYSSTFCDHPSYVLAGAILAAIWAAFVSIR
jgi:hypothetical protein